MSEGRVDRAVYRCRACRFGPRNTRVGWTDDDLAAMWYVTPGADLRGETFGGVTIALSLEVVPCEAHRVALEAAYPQAGA